MPTTPQSRARYWTGTRTGATEVVDVGVGRVAVYTAASPLHPERNEDAAAVFTLSGCTVVAVADGVGGLPGGDAASCLALEALGETLAELNDDAGGSRLRNALIDGFERGHDAIARAGAGGTTLVAIEARPGLLRTYHTGDSAVLVVDRDGDLRLQTVPHSPVGYAMESGLIDEQDALFHANRNVIFKCLGRDQMGLEIGWPFAVDSDDTALLASDGLFDNLTLAEIVEAVRDPDVERACDELASLARRRMVAHGDPAKPSKPDDLTLALYRPF